MQGWVSEGLRHALRARPREAGYPLRWKPEANCLLAPALELLKTWPQMCTEISRAEGELPRHFCYQHGGLEPFCSLRGGPGKQRRHPSLLSHSPSTALPGGGLPVPSEPPAPGNPPGLPLNSCFCLCVFCEPGPGTMTQPFCLGSLRPRPYPPGLENKPAVSPAWS